MSATKRKPRINPRSAKNVVAVAKVIGPAVAPVLLPFAAKAAATFRELKDNRKAHKLGVPVSDLAKFSGKGGVLHARIAGLAEVLQELRDRGKDADFVAETSDTLAKLTSAVRAAERMPTPKRKTVHRAVAAELDQLEQRLLHKLGI
ncbi:hypothetical protein ALI144C_42940 [Actinosynnema sp. ALI-1.44]|uniref:DUF6474 family protein n=1 Tax=Actinosynnema sp. ALI-1.44 TaxID=1933779 RepID=UPI00097C419F|nr:DUF6474 family protein [Actinosynnema sp. ALI-1.44]ONI72766.1 hypothetical protein ALI144C_42940 [Actinosynnema sp. ALI-1.44]